MTYTIWIVSPRGFSRTRCFEEIALSLQAAFRALGHDVPIVKDPALIKGTAIVLGMNNRNPSPPLPHPVIIYNFEQVSDTSKWFLPAIPYLDLLKQYLVWDYSPKNIAELKKRGVDAVLCGIGYMPELSRIEKAREDIDVLFVGEPHPRREKILKELRQAGLKVEHLAGVYGAERDAIVARSKIIINIHMYDAHIFEATRISYMLANKKCVISEVGTDRELEDSYEGAAVFCAYEELVSRCVEYSANDKKRRAQAQRGFKIFSAMSQAIMLEKALADSRQKGRRQKLETAKVPSIFVNIASYRDPECQWTVKDLFEKATYPERINVGICWQYDAEEDRECFAIDYPRPEQVRTIQYHYRDSQGLGWARKQAFTLWKGEDFVLQLDSHMRFEPGWDEMLLEMYRQCPHEKSLLTAWVPGYKPPDALEPDEGTVPRLFISHFGEAHEFPQYNTYRFYESAEAVKGRMDLSCNPIGNCTFAPSRAYIEAPIDPHINFWGEELNQATRLWTRGWDFFQFDRRVIYHYWDAVIKDRKTYRDRKNPRNNASRKRHLHLFGWEKSSDPAVIAELDKYSLGATRPLADYWRFIGVDFQAKTISEFARKGKWKVAAQPDDGLRMTDDKKASPSSVIRHPSAILVCIPSFRDTECQWTVKDLFEKAARPERIRVAICWQFDAKEDKQCFDIPYPRPDQVRVKNYHYKDAKGLGWARAEAFSLWNGEEYALQIDSHMRFEQGWDDALIDMLGRCPEKSVLSTYVPRYTPPDTKDRYPGEILRIALQSFADPGSPQIFHQGRTRVPLADKERSGLYRAPFNIGNFLFCRAEIFQRFPIDPHIQFWGEEVTLSARLWTHGYSIYQPDRVVAYHYWRRDELVPQQGYRRLGTPRSKAVSARIRHMLGLERTDNKEALKDIERYGVMGSERSLEDLWKFAGIDWEKRTIAKDSREGRWGVSQPVDSKQWTVDGKENIPSTVHRPQSTIFVNIACYRDPECQWTVKDLFEKAKYPDRINVGICWQFDPKEDEHCFKIPYPRPDQVRVHEVDASEGEGVCWARWQAYRLWKGEDYILQIDAHSRFVPGWDELMIAELKLCESDKALLSCYPPPYTPPDKLDDDPKTTICHPKPFMPCGSVRINGPYVGYVPEKPLWGAYIGANFIFAPSAMIAEVPYDPYLYFDQEEVTYAARLYTHGWDVFIPRQPMLFHRYHDGTAHPLHWADAKQKNNEKVSFYMRRGSKRFDHMTGHKLCENPEIIKELDIYGFGKVRSLQQFEEYGGIDFKRKIVLEKGLHSQFIRDRHKPSKPAIVAKAKTQRNPGLGGASRIFVNIASYRDPECQWTVKDLFEKAKYPDRINVGICWQFDPKEDEHCFQVTTRPDQVRMLPVDWREAEGVCWARNQTQQLWDGEDYTLMTDSHMRFVPGWDELMIQELADCESDKPLLSCSPASYVPPNQLADNLRPTVRRVRPFFPDGNLRCQGEMLDRAPEKPLRGAFMVANFAFSRADVINEVPYDPYLYFDQEEITYAARLYTHGWDVFSTRQQFLYHFYNDGKAGKSNRPLHWNDLRKEDGSKIAYLKGRGLKRFNHMTGHSLSEETDVITELDRYGFGNTRSLSQFEEFCGVDFKRKIASEKALRCLFIENFQKYRKNPVHIPEIDDKNSLPHRGRVGVGASVSPPVSNNAPLPASPLRGEGARVKPLEKGDFVPLFEVTDTEHRMRGIEIYGGQHCMLFFLPAKDINYLRDFFNHLIHYVSQATHKKAWQMFVLDDTVENLIALKEKINVPHPLWADPERKLAKAFGLYGDGEKTIRPAGYVLSANLRIMYCNVNLGAGPLAESIVKQCQAELAQYVAVNQDLRVISAAAPALFIPGALTPELAQKCMDSFRNGRTFEGTVGAEEKTGYRPNAKVRTDHIISGQLLDEIDEKFSRSVFPEIRKIFGFDVKYRELYKVGVYKGEKSGFFKQHRDNFEVPLAYRRIAMTVHLNDDYEGGGLRFPEYGEDIYRPKAGGAIAFSCATVHEARPVTKGERYILVCFFHGEEEEAFRRYYLAGKGSPLRIKDYVAALRPAPDIKQSRDFYKEWQAQNVGYSKSDAPLPVQQPVPKVQLPFIINMPGKHQPKKVFESKQGVVFDDFLPEDVCKKLFHHARQLNCRHINNDTIRWVWRVHDGSPIRSAADFTSKATGPESKHAYPTQTVLDRFFEQMLAVQPHVEHFIGKQDIDWNHFSATAWGYPPGTGLSLHDDGAGTFSGAYTYFLNPFWRPHWGGMLMLADDEGNRLMHQSLHNSEVEEGFDTQREDQALIEHGFAQCIFPKKNRIVFIAKGSYHMITRVNEAAGDHVRMSLAGFFYRKKNIA